MIKFNSDQDLKDFVGCALADMDLPIISASSLSNYLQLSGDRNPIHDPTKKEKPIIPGNMIILQIPSALQSRFQLSESTNALTTAYDIKFKNPAYLGDRLVLKAKLHTARPWGRSVHVKWDISIHEKLTDKLHLTVILSEIYMFVN